MKKLFTLAAAVIASMAMNADVIFGPFTLTADNNVKDQVTAVDGGSVTVTTAFATGGSNEVTVNEQTFYKFNSSSAITCALADAATFEEGDSIVILTASHASSKKTTGVKLTWKVLYNTPYLASIEETYEDGTGLNAYFGFSGKLIGLVEVK